MFKNLDGENLVNFWSVIKSNSPNFHIAKVSLHMVLAFLKWNFIFNLRKTGTAKTGPAGLFRRPCSFKINLSCTVQKSTQTFE